MKTFILLMLAYILCSVSSCNKGDLPAPGSTSIVGKWRWVRSVGGIGGFTLTPQSTGVNMRNEFYADSTFKSFRNDSLTANRKFSIARNYKYTPTETVDVLKMNDNFSQAFLIRNDTLYINDVFISDGFSTTYVKIK